MGMASPWARRERKKKRKGGKTRWAKRAQCRKRSVRSSWRRVSLSYRMRMYGYKMFLNKSTEPAILLSLLPVKTAGGTGGVLPQRARTSRGVAYSNMAHQSGWQRFIAQLRTAHVRILCLTAHSAAIALHLNLCFPHRAKSHHKENRR